MTTQLPFADLNTATELAAALTPLAKKYQMEKCFARWPKPEEIGTIHTTYVPDGLGGGLIETRVEIKEGNFIVMFYGVPMLVCGQVLSNSWVAKSNKLGAYGLQSYENLPEDGSWILVQKTVSDSFIPITDEVLEIVAAHGFATEKVAVDWAEGGSMPLMVGGLWSPYGHTVHPEMAKEMYSLVE